MMPKMCELCRKPTQPLMSVSRPQASEWYCAACHHSHPMSADEYIYLSGQTSGRATTAVTEDTRTAHA